MKNIDKDKLIREYEEIIEELGLLSELNEDTDYNAIKKLRDKNPYSLNAKSLIYDEKFIIDNLNELNEINKMREERVALLAKSLKPKKKIRITPLIRFSLRVAAAVLFVSMLIYYVNDRVGYEELAHNVVEERVDLGDKTILILEGGEEVSLEEIIKEQEGRVTVSQLQSFTSVATKKEVVVAQEQEVLISHINRLIIPRKQTVTLVLSDSTEVTLDANTELEYPDVFTSEERWVNLKRGNAYFKVAKSSTPFIAKTISGGVRVYGTEFNIRLNSDTIMTTVLVSGSVGVTPSGGEQEEFMITPSEMAVVNKEGDYDVSTVDVRRFIAWRDGLFRTSGGRFGDFIDEISEWYGIEFINQSEELRELAVTASISRKLPANEVVEAIGMLINRKITNEGNGKYEII